MADNIRSKRLVNECSRVRYDQKTKDRSLSESDASEYDAGCFYFIGTIWGANCRRALTSSKLLVIAMRRIGSYQRDRPLSCRHLIISSWRGDPEKKNDFLQCWFYFLFVSASFGSPWILLMIRRPSTSCLTTPHGVTIMCIGSTLGAAPTCIVISTGNPATPIPYRVSPHSLIMREGIK